MEHVPEPPQDRPTLTGAPTLPAPERPLPQQSAVFAAPAPGSVPHPPPMLPPPTVVPMATTPASTGRPRRGILVAGLGAMTVAAVAGGAFFVTRDAGDTITVDDATELATDADVEVGYSFAAATGSAQSAASVVFEMEIDSPEGPMSATASFDRASSRLAMDLDLSQLVDEDEFFDIGDSISFIIDEQTQSTYVSAALFGDMFGATEGWVSLTDDEFTMDDDEFGDVFSNPLDIADIFGDVEPLDLGDETIDGETLRHYQVTLDDDALADLDDDAFGAPTVSEADVDVTYDVWVDESSRIRRILFDATSNGETGTVDMWITISGDPIDIELPAPDEVIDLDELFAGAFEDFDAGTEVSVEDD